MKIKFKKILEKINIFCAVVKKIPRKMAEKTFWLFLGTIFLALVFAPFLFYRYGFFQKSLDERVRTEVFFSPVQFDEKALQEILQIWKTRQKNFDQADNKIYFNPFLSKGE